MAWEKVAATAAHGAGGGRYAERHSRRNLSKRGRWGTLALGFAAASWFSSTLRAANQYWDINGTTAGAGGAAPAGTWNSTNTNWSSSTTGTTTTAVWISGNTAVFSAGTTATGTFTVTTSSTPSVLTVGGIIFQEGAVTLSGSLIQIGPFDATFDVASALTATMGCPITGAHAVTKTGAGTLVYTSTSNSYSGGTTINAGVLTITTDANLGAPTGTVTLNGGTLRTAGAVVSNRKIILGAGGGTIDSNGFDSSFADVDPGNFTKNGSGKASVRSLEALNVTINAGTLAVKSRAATGGNHPARMNALSINPAATLDLNDNDLVVSNGVFSDIQALVLGGFGNPSNPGIVSSTSDATQILALFDNALIGATEWAGQTIAANAIVGKYTYIGDLNLDGQVTGDDYGVVDGNLGTMPSPEIGWINGDANLDGRVTGDDYGVIDGALGLGMGDPLGPSGTVVPEPGAGIGILLGLPILCRRRRR